MPDSLAAAVKYNDDGWPLMQWFGESWGAPVCEFATHAETPVGEPCAQECGFLIEAGDRGFLIPLLRLDGEPVLQPQHRGCFMRDVLGPAWVP